jgi:hypothetical protein
MEEPEPAKDDAQAGVKGKRSQATIRGVAWLFVWPGVDMQVSVSGNGRVIAEIIRRKGLRSGPAWREAAKGVGDDWLRKVQSLSAVQYASTAQLRRLGHPYSRAGFRAGGRAARAGLPMPAHFINRQTGRLSGGWLLKIQNLANSVVVRITNSAPYFLYLHYGTRKMIPRPILRVALAMTERERQSRYERASRQIHGYGG